ncbi:8-oxoguanine DNA glycosylase OGG fold protein [Streptomyces sp. NPDC055025]
MLDRVLSRRLRRLAAEVGRETGYDPDGSIAAWVWADRNWTAHRYGVYLSFAAARQLAAGGGWPSSATPDLLECALFNAAWE